jgi:hypothetical protein
VALPGCGGREGIVAGSGSVDQATRNVEVSVNAVGHGLKYTVLVVTYPDGHKVMAAAATLRDGQCTWFGQNMPPGDYSYTGYWVPMKGEAKDYLAEDVVSHGTSSGPIEFTVE